jgi:undecaprenyl-diphosphatase
MTGQISPPQRARSGVGSWLAGLQRTETRLLLTILGVLAALWGFLALTDEVREGDTSRLDRHILLAFRTPGDLGVAVGPRWVQESARDFTALGGFTTLTLIAVMAFAILMLLGRRTQALVFGAAVIFAQVASEGVKRLVDRPRPDLVPQHDLVYSASFPSGHAMMAPVVYLTLAAIVAAGNGRQAIKALLLIGAALLVVVIGVSRVYLGVHWPSDVLAGWTLGTAIALAASFALYKTAPRRGPAAEVKADQPAADSASMGPQEQPHRQGDADQDHQHP